MSDCYQWKCPNCKRVHYRCDCGAEPRVDMKLCPECQKAGSPAKGGKFMPMAAKIVKDEKPPMLTNRENGMKPGPELDALVAKNVMEWHLESMPPLPPSTTRQVMWNTGRTPSGAGSVLIGIDQFKPSVNIAAALEVVEALTQPNRPSDFELYKSRGGYSACFLGACFDGVDRNGAAETAPHAICLAALKAVGVTIYE